MLPTVGFIGLGNMGSRMAANLMRAGFPLIVNDINKTAVSQAVQNGAKSAESPAELAAKSDAIVTMLPSPALVREVYAGPKGILEGAKKGAFFIDSSTIDPSTARSVTELAVSANANMVDAPVSGGIMAAENATLTFMVGGSEEGFGLAKPILSKMGKNIVYCGASGSGQVAKICNNLVLAISMIGVSEGMNLGVKLGMDPKILAGIFNTSSGRCWSSDTYNPCPGVMDNVPSSRGYTGGFAVNLMRKDLGLAVETAESIRAPLVLGSTANQLYNLCSLHGFGDKDFSAIYQYLQNQQSRK
eukprot:TRINITY_DN4719_c0_g2_i1.p1 TRINITY_DN4719_c0_g2~~TRINITY_DN4719_c0_g2_i1.p1  ORF type:complete len:301 (+),score=75.74 TRINITY_DN4719_c0_g2_i1:69-971(+)